MTSPAPGPQFDVFPPEGTVFAFDDEQVTYADLVVVSVMSGEWDGFLEAAARGAASLDRPVNQLDLRRAAERFRRARRLEAAEDLRSWLQARQLSSAQWRDALRRSVALTADEGDENDATPATKLGTPSPESLNADAFCTGLWERASARVAAWLAAQSLEPGGGVPMGPEDLAGAVRAAGVPGARVESVARWRRAHDALVAASGPGGRGGASRPLP